MSGAIVKHLVGADFFNPHHWFGRWALGYHLRFTKEDTKTLGGDFFSPVGHSKKCNLNLNSDSEDAIFSSSPSHMAK